MSFDLIVDARRRLVRVTGTGDSDIQTALAHIEATANELVANPGFGLVVDIRRSTNLPTMREVQTIIEALWLRRSAFDVGIGFVVGGTVQFGVARMASIVGDLRGLRIHAFRSVEDAEEWLVPAGPVPPVLR